MNKSLIITYCLSEPVITIYYIYIYIYKNVYLLYLLFNGGNFYFVEVSEGPELAILSISSPFSRQPVASTPDDEGKPPSESITIQSKTGQQQIIYIKNYEIQTIQLFCHDVSFIQPCWVNGLDFYRFCAPGHIIQMSNSQMF